MSISPEHKVFLQTSQMFGAVFLILKDLEPEKTKEVLDSVVEEGNKSEAGNDIASAVRKTLYGEDSE